MRPEPRMRPGGKIVLSCPNSGRLEPQRLFSLGHVSHLQMCVFFRVAADHGVRDDGSGLAGQEYTIGRSKSGSFSISPRRPPWVAHLEWSLKKSIVSVLDPQSILSLNLQSGAPVASRAHNVRKYTRSESSLGDTDTMHCLHDYYATVRGNATMGAHQVESRLWMG